jgi:hypothetical protein
MSDGQLRFPMWQAALQELAEESDPSKVNEKMQMVETLILERMQILYPSSVGCSEEEALREALRTLRTIKRDKLGYPDWQ